MKKTERTLLLVEDESSTREVLNRFLKMDYRVVLCASGDEAIRFLDDPAASYDAVLTDLRMNGADGFAVLEAAKRRQIPCVVFTAYGSIETAVEAMRLGAYDFVTKPISFDRLELLLERLFEQKEIKDENIELKRKLKEVTHSDGGMIGHSKAMRDVLDLIRQVAPTRVTLLITGESGTGKELAAELIHRESGRRGNFVPVHCAALPETLLESELFGHEKGAFTGASERHAGRFEAASGGTLFLDEIGEISPAVQVKLLRVLESQRFERVGGREPISTDARIVTATNRDLTAMTQNGTFREDLYFRLDVVRIHLPALRERSEDIPLLVHAFMERFALENGCPIPTLSEEAMHLLTIYRWPGNIRELRNCIERMVILARNPHLTVDNVPTHIRYPQSGSASVMMNPSQNTPLDLNLNERQLIEQALAACGGNRTLAAEKLGISRRTLHRKLHLYGQL